MDGTTLVYEVYHAMLFAHTLKEDQQYVPTDRRTVRTDKTRDECNGTHTTNQ